MTDVVKVQHLSKRYAVYRRPADRLWEALLPWRGPRHEDFWALRDVSFEVRPGEVFGIVGPNGAGKSTLLQLVSGIVQPDSGRVVAEGRVAALLELGAGFNPEFTGRENALLHAEMLGAGRAEAERHLEAVENFADIGRFFDRPVKEYSTGMYVRLAFSSAIHVRPDVLIIDEALAVGDALFSSRCMRRLKEMKGGSTTMLLVSHDLGVIKQICDRALLLVGGRPKALGDPQDVVNRYVGLVHSDEQGDGGQADASGGRGTPSFRHGDRSSIVTGVEVVDSRGQARSSVTMGDTATVVVQVTMREAVDELVVGILLRTRLGIDVYGTNTRVEGKRLGPFAPGERAEVRFAFRCVLRPQEYTVTVATQHADGRSQDWLDDVLAFRVTSGKDIAGLVDLEASVTVSNGVERLDLQRERVTR